MLCKTRLRPPASARRPRLSVVKRVGLPPVRWKLCHRTNGMQAEVLTANNDMRMALLAIRHAFYVDIMAIQL